MTKRHNYYRILQVQPDASIEVIKASYRAIMKKLKQHPDLGGSHSNASTINEAYCILSNPRQRAEYDRTLARAASRAEKVRSQPQDTVPGPYSEAPVSTVTIKHLGNKRRYQRFAERIRQHRHIIYYTSWPGKGSPAKIVDFSPKGLRFIATHRIHPHKVIKLESPLLRATAKVTNCQKDRSSSEYAIGVVFLSVEFAKERGLIISASA